MTLSLLLLLCLPPFILLLAYDLVVGYTYYYDGCCFSAAYSSVCWLLFILTYGYYYSESFYCSSLSLL